tara:strand:+ start:703 stop:1371 length:669 start_codon:yes stop_codon:yes gene_type:complete
MRTFCWNAGCKNIVTTGRCKPCERKRQQRQKKTKKSKEREKFYNSSAWKQLRQYHIDGSPLCVHCLTYELLTPAQQVDHKQARSKRPDLQLDPDNLQSLCRKCHGDKTKREQQPGKITIVCGDPGSGKTTHVERYAKPGSIVFDYDKLAATVTLDNFMKASPADADLIPLIESFRAALVEWLKSWATERNVWIIVTREDRAEDLAGDLGGNLVNLGGKGQLS